MRNDANDVYFHISSVPMRMVQGPIVYDYILYYDV